GRTRGAFRHEPAGRLQASKGARTGRPGIRRSRRSAAAAKARAGGSYRSRRLAGTAPRGLGGGLRAARRTAAELARQSDVRSRRDFKLISGQVSSREEKSVQKVIPFMWFDGQAREAARFYTEIFGGAEPEGAAGGITFEVGGLKVNAFDGGPMF